MPEKRGGFITFEGGEGVGKSTQVRRLAKRLDMAGFETVTTREPGGSPRAEEIRGALLAGRVKPLGPAAEAIMFSAARLDHVETCIRPALERGAFVICDRFADSTRAYQGALGDLSPTLVGALERVAVGDCRPALTIVLDLPEEEGLARARRRRGDEEAPDRFEAEDLAFHRGLREAFLAIAAAEPRRCRVIEAGRTAEAVAQDVWAAAVETFPLLRGAPPP